MTSSLSTNISLTDSEATSVIQAQNLQRLKINRVAIAQMLKVEHVLPVLLAHDILSQEDKKIIMSKKSTQDKTRLLVDLLPNRGKEADWYGWFCKALRNPDSRNMEVKKKYAILIDFLNNSILPSNPRCNKQEKLRLPHYDPLPNIMTSSESENKFNNGSKVTFDLVESNAGDSSCIGAEKSVNDAAVTEKESTGPKVCVSAVRDQINKLMTPPDNFASIIREPKEHFAALKSSDIPGDIILYEKEVIALNKVKELEILIAVQSRGIIPSDVPFCMSSIVAEVFGDACCHFLYFKYFRYVKENYNLDIPSEVAGSFYNLAFRDIDINDSETRQVVFDVAFGLFEFFHSYGIYHRAESVLYALIHILAQHPGIETWMATWEAFVKLMEARNTNVSFKEADWVYNSILSLADRIKLMSFGKDLLDESPMFCELSRMMKEQGSISPAYSWSLEALKEVEATNEVGIVEVLMCASQACCLSYRVKKAEQLAIEAIKQAKKLFGVNSPMYIKTLLNYCQYASEFRQDNMAIDVAKQALALSEKLYVVSDVMTALSHQAVATALIATESFSTEEHFTHAHTAWKIALDVIPGNHPRLATFRYTLARSLHFRALHGSAERAQGNLVWAETEAKAALTYFTQHWGAYSLRTAQSYTLLAQIYAKMERYTDAENMLLTSMSVHRLSVASYSKQMFLMKATLGMFYKTVGRPKEAVMLLQDVVDNIDCEGVHLKWVPLAYNSLISLFRSLNEPDNVRLYQAGLIEWQQKNPYNAAVISWHEIHADPLPYSQWLEQFEEGSQRAKENLRRGFKNLKESLSSLGLKN